MAFRLGLVRFTMSGTTVVAPISTGARSIMSTTRNKAIMASSATISNTIALVFGLEEVLESLASTEDNPSLGTMPRRQRPGRLPAAKTYRSLERFWPLFPILGRVQSVLVTGAYLSAAPEEVLPVLNRALVRLHSLPLAAGTSFTYVYDFRDNWEVQVKVERVLPRDPGTHQSFLLGGERAFPPV